MLKTNVYNVICNWSTRMRLPLINSNASDTMCALTLARLCIPFHVFVSSSFASTSVSILSAFFESYLFGWAHNIRCICAASIHPDEEISCGRRATTIKFKPNKTLIFFFSPEQIKPNQDAMCRDSDFFFSRWFRGMGLEFILLVCAQSLAGMNQLYDDKYSEIGKRKLEFSLFRCSLVNWINQKGKY